jgi:hypothetical protein
VERFEDVFSLVWTCLQWRSIINTGASVVEGLYGLKRVTYVDGKARQISKRQRALSILLMIVLPRLMDHLRDLATQLNRQTWSSLTSEAANYEPATNSTTPPFTVSSFQNNPTRFLRSATERLTHAALQTAVRGFAVTFPYVELAGDLTTLAYKLLYVCRRSEHHHPVFALLDMTLVKARHVNTADTLPTGPADSTSTAVSIPTSNVPNAVVANWPVTVVLMLILAVRTAEYLQSQRASLSASSLSRRLSTPAPLPAVPKPAPVGRGCVIPPIDASLCALCNRKRTNPCASTSGYVLCYMCLLPYVREHKSCPVTGLPCTELGIIRLYEEEEESGNRAVSPPDLSV